MLKGIVPNLQYSVNILSYILTATQLQECNLEYVYTDIQGPSADRQIEIGNSNYCIMKSLHYYTLRAQSGSQLVLPPGNASKLHQLFHWPHIPRYSYEASKPKVRGYSSLNSQETNNCLLPMPLSPSTQQKPSTKSILNTAPLSTIACCTYKGAASEIEGGWRARAIV